jgi:hypothetical protein
MGNISQHQQQNQFDPFGQFNLNSMTGDSGVAKAQQAGGRPASATTTTSSSSKPPTGNSYQPYYMQQNQSQHRNGTQAQGAQQTTPAQNQGSKQGTKPKATSTFHTRPQSPNYNPSMFSTAGNKTGR